MAISVSILWHNSGKASGTYHGTTAYFILAPGPQLDPDLARFSWVNGGSDQDDQNL